MVNFRFKSWFKPSKPTKNERSITATSFIASALPVIHESTLKIVESEDTGKSHVVPDPTGVNINNDETDSKETNSVNHNKDFALSPSKKNTITADAHSKSCVATSTVSGIKALKKDPAYPGVYHGTPSHGFSRTIRKFFKKSWWNREKVSTEDNGSETSVSDNTSFSSISEWEDPYGNPILRKREYMLLIFKEASGKKGFLSSIDIDKQIGFANRYHKIRRWKNKDSKFLDSHTTEEVYKPWELVPAFCEKHKEPQAIAMKLSSSSTDSVKSSQKDQQDIFSTPLLSSTDNVPMNFTTTIFLPKSAPTLQKILPDVIENVSSAPVTTDMLHSNRGFISRFAPIQPAIQDDLLELARFLKTKESKPRIKNNNPRFAPRNRIAQRDLEDVARLLVSYNGDETKVNSPFVQEIVDTSSGIQQQIYYESEVAHDDITAVSPNLEDDYSHSPCFFTGDLLPERVSVSRQNDNGDFSIISGSDISASISPNNSRNFLYHSSTNNFEASSGTQSMTAPSPPLEHSSEELTTFVFDVNMQQNVEAIIYSRDHFSSMAPEENRQNLSEISSSGFIYDVNIHQNVDAIIASEHFEEHVPKSPDWNNYEAIFPKRDCTGINDVRDTGPIFPHYPSLQSLNTEELSDKSSPHYYDAENKLNSMDHNGRKSTSSLETIIHYNLQTVLGDSASPQSDDDFDVSNLQINNDEESPLSNIGGETFPQTKDFGSLFDAAAKIKNHFHGSVDNQSAIRNLGDAVIMTTLLASNVSTKTETDNVDHIVTVNDDNLEPCIFLPTEEKNDENNNCVDISFYKGQGDETIAELQKKQAAPFVQQWEFETQNPINIDGLDPSMESNNVDSLSSVENLMALYDRNAGSINQEVQRLGVYRTNNCTQQEPNYDEIIRFILGVSSPQDFLYYRETATEPSEDYEMSMSTEEKFEDEDEAEDEAENNQCSWNTSDLTTSFHSVGVPSFVEELFGDQDCAPGQSSRVLDGPAENELPYDSQRTNDSKTTSQVELRTSITPPQPVELREEISMPIVPTEDSSITRRSPLESICYVHWPIIEENWIAKALGEYCPLKFRNNIRFNYDSPEFRIRQYYMTTKALLQEQYKTHPNLIFSPKPGKWLNFEWETDILDTVDDFIRINKNLQPMFKGPRIIQRKHLVRRWRNRERDRLIILGRLLDDWREDPTAIDQLKREKKSRRIFPFHHKSLSVINDEPPERPSLKLILSKIFEKITMDVAHKKLGRPPREGSSVVLLKRGPPLGIDYFGYKRDKAKEWVNNLLLKL